MTQSYSDRMMALDGLYTQARRTADYRRYQPIVRVRYPGPLAALWDWLFG